LNIKTAVGLSVLVVQATKQISTQFLSLIATMQLLGEYNRSINYKTLSMSAVSLFIPSSRIFVTADESQYNI